jgi:Uma2 family endonuclease
MRDAALAFPPPVAELRIASPAFEAMIEAGVFAEAEGKVELDGGKIIVSPMDGGPHLNVGQRLGMLWWPTIAAEAALKARLRLFIPGAIRVGEGVMSAPDAMLAPPETVGKRRWPSAAEALLAVEFADTTLAYDDGRKRANYARGGLAELWVVRINQQDVRVCRGPRADGGWDEEGIHAGAAVIAPLAAPELAIAVAALFAD